LKPESLLIKARGGQGVGGNMRKIWVGAAAVFALVAIAVAVFHFRGDLFRSAPPAGPQTSWVPVPHPPGDRPKPEIALIREFGPWHLACIRQAQQLPKVGIIQNLGVLPSNGDRPNPCHVFIMMQDRAAPQQTMVMNFRYRSGLPAPDLAFIYTALGKPHVFYDRSGQVQDLSKKKLTLHGGFYRDLRKAPPEERQRVQSQDIPAIGVQLGRTSLTVQTLACIRGHCFGRLSSAPTAAIGSATKIVVRLPGPPRGRPRTVDVPTDGLNAALAELGRMNPS
jgi:hypothetical protein